MEDKKGFTLIELITVSVITSILVIITLPFVMNIIKNTKESSRRRSIESYGRSVELAVSSYLLDRGSFPSNLKTLNVEYSGDKVECNIMMMKENGSVYLSECKVNNKYVFDNESKDGYYHYGMDQVYDIGDIITYKNEQYYVIKYSGLEDLTVTLLKAEPLTVEEVNLYGGASTENNHVNRYTNSSRGTAFDINGYGGVAYYSSETCGYNPSWTEAGCTTNYAQSDIKYIIDTWADKKISNNNLEADSTGYKARLITIYELMNYLGYETYQATDNVPKWVYNVPYYWTMSAWDEQTKIVCVKGNLDSYNYVYEKSKIVRPVINLKKSAIN